MKTLQLITLAIVLTTGASAQLIQSEAAAPSAKIAQEIIGKINAELEHRVRIHRDAFALLWRSPNATPAAILEQLGTSAVLVFLFSRENLDHIDRCAKLVGKTRADFLTDAECTPPHELVYHADGRVTLKPQ
jgi:hypothetical protein